MAESKPRQSDRCHPPSPLPGHDAPNQAEALQAAAINMALVQKCDGYLEAACNSRGVWLSQWLEKISRARATARLEMRLFRITSKLFGATRAMSNSATKMETAIEELAAAFPAAFTLDPTLVRPVKLGIKDDIYAQSAVSRRRITAALRSYCNSVHYLRASTEGAVRIDLIGESVGTVTATEARHATERLAALAKVAAKRASKVAATSTGAQTPKGAGTDSPQAATATPKPSNISNRTVATEATTPGQKRLSLGDLKRAAAARKVMR